MTVPYLDLSKSYGEVRDELESAFSRVLESGYIMLGNEVKEFEKQYAHFSSVAYCAGVGNGLDALTLALTALGVHAGDEVIVPSNTYIATLISVSRVGATPILVEPKIDTYNIDSQQIDRAITKKTKVIMPVHLFGQACQMDHIMEIAKRHKLAVVEDNAQSHGATFKNKPTGSFGAINATSFYPGKNIGALGDGGAITTDSAELYEQILQLRNYGEVKKYVNDIIGYNSRLDELQAAFLKVRLQHIAKNTERRRKIAAIYQQELAGIGDIILPVIEKYATHVYHVYPIRTKKRDALQAFLKEHHVITLIHYPIPPHLQHAYASLGYFRGSFPIAEELADTSLSLPIFPEISEEQLFYVLSQIKDFYKGK
jgi:dTDP-4-amino-4,6-dideoxygalactose transaminase